ncbi:MAG: hypothetical protein AAF253_00435 [Pseudomonadota bacterium]
MLALLVLVRDLVVAVLIGLIGAGDAPEDGQKSDENAAAIVLDWSRD